MGFFVGAILIITISLVGVALFAFWLLNRSAGAAFTDRFRDAEFILAHHRAPPAWTKPKRGFVWLLQRTPATGRRRHTRNGNSIGADIPPAQNALLARLDALIAFFETCPFFDNEETRRLLLQELNQERVDWAERNLEEIIGTQRNEA